ncbi:raffinose/stachyose/melibiose transport system substrate-binding protein [Geodermatophilus telluris]|uniref:Raffinose/stachyose/melibiose transport system substrate-binding protein n=1 Tax=Geodermatophilus telluris TaxID=1190417 RepID=A0A1G6NV02_9ACTN|nr:extracellular solute-binding protein [Geodermatophilus telluris]SDC71619.1 raffinose/stachyose/melibiose transport system substrate-binding protein [Geodermatophilus telluris]
MRSSSKVLVTSAVCLLATACTGQSSSSGGDGGGGDGERLVYLVEQLEDADSLSRLEDHLADFTESSGIEVEVQQLDIDTMRTVLQTRLRAEDGPDVISWGSGPSFAGALAEAGLLYDLTDAYEENGWEVYDFAKERVTYDGKVYGIPGEMETVGLFYNTQVLADLGIEPPRTLDDLRAACEAISAAGVVPMAFGDQDAWPGSHLLSMALSSAVGADGMEALLAGEGSWESPEVVDALTFWQEANQNGWLGESPVSIDYDTMTAQYLSGEAAMIPTGSWFINDLAVGADFESGYVPFPAPDGEGVFAAGLGSGPLISANTDDPEGAIELLDFFASEEHGEWSVENLQTIPPRPVDTEGLEIEPLLAQVLDDVSTLSEGGGQLGYNIDVLMPEAFNEAMFDGIQALLTGQSTPAEVAAAMQAASQA